MKKFISSLLILSSFSLLSQQNNIWIFGNQAGMDFNPGPPVPVTSTINAPEATGSVCDNTGSLLFYTNSNTVWDRTNTPMPNGTGLTGGTSATQVLIVQKPLDCSKYYIFHVSDHMGPGDFRWSLVDMCLNNGFGDVVVASKNVLLQQPCGEKITAVAHPNGIDIWVITHELTNANFRAYLVTAAGINPAVLSTVGGVHAANEMIGPLKASHNGQKLVLANTFGNRFEMFDFNSMTGVVTNMVNLFPQTTPYNGCVYGLEFSPNDSEIYFTTCWTGNFIVQLDIMSMTTTQLANTPGNNQYLYGMIQLAPDGKLYVARNNQQFLDVINNPNTVGPGCGYTAAGFGLNVGSQSFMGLPNFIPSTLTAQPITNFINLGNDTIVPCPLAPYTITANSVCNSTYLWQNGATTNTMNINAQGTYWVIVNNICGSDTDSIVVTASGQPQVNIVTNTPSICIGSSAILTASGSSSFTWYPANSLSGTTGITVAATPTSTTTYTVIGTDVCGTDTAFITVTVNPLPVITILNDTAVCPGSTVTLTGSGGIFFTWSPSTSLSSSTGITVTASPTATTTYSVVGIDINSCTATGNVTVTVHPLPIITATPSHNLCLGDTSVLTASGGMNYIWTPVTGLSSSTGSTVSAFPTSTTTYIVSGTSSVGCPDTGNVTVTIVTASQAAFSSLIIPCATEVSFSNNSVGGIDFMWYFGDGDSSQAADPVHTFQSGGNFLVTLVVNPNTSCADSLTSTVIFDLVSASDVYIPNCFTPNNDVLNEVFEIFGPVDCFFVRMQIYDRWGHKIWETDRPMYNFWDGKINGNTVQEDVYVYRLEYKDKTAQYGHVTVIR